MPTDGRATGLGTRDLLMIHQLLAYYGHVVDDRYWARFDELFTPDATIDYTRAGAATVHSGLEEIRAFFADANHPSAHHVLNIVVTPSDGEVRVRSKFFVPYTRETHTPKRWFGGDYDDIVVRTDEGWRFVFRRCTGRWQFTTDEEPVPPHRRTW
ncbi:MAG TPA: nuclear transport factor 2 family protein [Mycobacteriales bacterium]|nr:nuclear transport factor 2 family protein [Mycobacteriales bacterium]